MNDRRRPPHVVLVAAENGTHKDAKVGGIADVIKEVPAALVKRGISVTVIIPSHGFLHESLSTKKVSDIPFDFAGRTETANVFEVNNGQPEKSSPKPLVKVRQLVVHHRYLASTAPGELYVNDGDNRPFARDATRFACFSSATAALIESGLDEPVDVIHLNDWHTGFIAILRNTGHFEKLRETRLVFTIHNLAYQGIRPINDDESSFSTWFPDIGADRQIIGDPRWPWCVNPMAAAIRLSDAIHVVSRTYAEEIQKSDNPALGAGTGGCGLESLLATAQSENRLFGVLNGCHYEAMENNTRINWKQVQAEIRKTLSNMSDASNPLGTARATEILDQQSASCPAPLVTSVGRLTEQKVALLVEPVDADALALDAVLKALGPAGLLVMLGTGDPQFEQTFADVAKRHDNFLFILGFSDSLANALYQGGDLFLMPSSFEPCGISQMLAMRAGQPCLVHSVGGLKDTVIPGVNGFAFAGDSRAARAKALVTCAAASFAHYRDDSEVDWERFRTSAAKARFEWSDTIDAYVRLLYSPAVRT